MECRLRLRSSPQFVRVDTVVYQQLSGISAGVYTSDLRCFS